MGLGDPAEAQEISAHVTIETSAPGPSGTERQPVGREANVVPRSQPSLGQWVSHDLLLGRWRLSLDLFGRVFTEDVGLEPGSVVSELGGFPVKEAKFRRDTEKLRSTQQRDLTLHKMERDRAKLLTQTFMELNNAFSGHNRRTHGTQPPLAVNRVKVTFKDEPGEGSGVARSFYTSIAEALLANEKLPLLESTGSTASNGTNASNNGSSSTGTSGNRCTTATPGGARTRGKETNRRIPTRPVSRATPTRTDR